MPATNDHAVRVLNSLIETAIDSAKDYQQAAQLALSPHYKSLFEKRSLSRSDLVRKLQDEVRSFGGEPQHRQSVMAKLHNKFVDMAGTFSPNVGDQGVIDAVERGDDTLKDRFAAASRDDSLPPAALDLVTTAYAAVKADHDQMTILKREMN